MVIKYDMNSVKQCQNKLILVMSDNFDRKVCNELKSAKNYLENKILYTIRYYIFRSTNYQAMLNLVQSVV